jgi:PAP2 superfamily
MKRTNLRAAVVAVVLGAVALAVGTSGSAAGPTKAANTTISPQAVLDWNAIAVDTVRAATPAKFQIEGGLYMTYVQAAVYDAVAATTGKGTPYRKLKVSIPGASPRAAVASAAYSTLSYFFPAQAATLTSTYTSYLNVTLSNLTAEAKQAGVAVGAAAAADLIASRWGDGRDAPISTPYGVGPQPAGTWVFAPAPSAPSAQTPWVGFMKPFLLDSASQFRSPAPPALTSAQYATDVNEVKSLGSVGSTARTAEQTAIGQFWNANVINQYAQMFRDVAKARNFDLNQTARLLAMGTMVGSDAGIACMDSKYHYLLWRPVTAIRAADTDGNPATDPSPSWSPLLTTPNHPEYPSAHGCVTAATVAVLESLLKTKNINIDVPGATSGGTTLTTSRHFNTSDELLSNVANARVWAGLHYRFATTAGVELGKAVAKWDLDHFGSKK